MGKTITCLLLQIFTRIHYCYSKNVYINPIFLKNLLQLNRRSRQTDEDILLKAYHGAEKKREGRVKRSNENRTKEKILKIRVKSKLPTDFSIEITDKAH